MAVNVPVFTSSLLLVPMVVRMLPAGWRVGILTTHSRRLTGRVLASAGIVGKPIVIMSLGFPGLAAGLALVAAGDVAPAGVIFHTRPECRVFPMAGIGFLGHSYKL